MDIIIKIVHKLSQQYFRGSLAKIAPSFGLYALPSKYWLARLFIGICQQCP